MDGELLCSSNYSPIVVAMRTRTKAEKAVGQGDNPVENWPRRAGPLKTSQLRGSQRSNGKKDSLWIVERWPDQRFWPGRLWPNGEDQQPPLWTQPPLLIIFIIIARLLAWGNVATRSPWGQPHNAGSSVSASNFIIKNPNNNFVYFLALSPQPRTANDDDTSTVCPLFSWIPEYWIQSANIPLIFPYMSKVVHKRRTAIGFDLWRKTWRLLYSIFASLNAAFHLLLMLVSL